jgi:hypothetical protein
MIVVYAKNRWGMTILIAAWMLLVGLGLHGSSANAFPGVDFGARWCGHDASRDWVCHQRGAVYQNGSLISRDRAVVANEGQISTASLSKARLSFRNQAICTLEESSEIYPRYGPTNSLYSQERGASSCTSPRGKSIRLLCGRREGCPAQVRTRGTSLFKVFDTAAARSSAVEDVHRQARIVSCSGFIKVIVANGEVFQGGSNGRNRFVVVITESRRVTSEEGFEEAEESLEVTLSGRIPGRGDCRDRLVREQEAAARD